MLCVLPLQSVGKSYCQVGLQTYLEEALANQKLAREKLQAGINVNAILNRQVVA